jgi:peptidoglycan/LPS O-acetylase OafA/YrhL
MYLAQTSLAQDPVARTKSPATPVQAVKESSSRIAFADALRATAILAVVACHLGLRTHVRVLGHGVGLTWLGLWAVDCFFVLTGYLLSKPFLRAIADEAEFPSTKLFLTRRFLRIYPFYFVAVIVSAAAEIAFGTTPAIGDLISHLTMTHGFFPEFISGLNAPLWTMSVDAQFYLALPIVAYGAMKVLSRIDSASRDRAIWIGLAGIVLFSVAERALALTLSLSHFGDQDYKFVVSRNVLGMSGDFAIGIAFAFREMRVPKPTQKRFVYVAMVCGSMLLLVALIPLAEASRHLSTQLFANSIMDLVGGISAGLLLHGCSRGSFAGLVRIVRSRWVATIAVLSYGIYLFHDLYIWHVGLLFDGKLTVPSHFVLFALGVMIPIVVTAWAGHALVERRFLVLRDKQR